MIRIISEHSEDLLMRYHQHLILGDSLCDEATIGRHIAAAREFLSWYESRTGTPFQFNASTSLIITHYQASLKARGVQPVVIAHYQSALKRLHRWADRAPVHVSTRSA